MTLGAGRLDRPAARLEPVQLGSTPIRFAYLPPTSTRKIELIEHGPAIDGFFAMVREAAQGWDGRKPVRRL
jgi:hypothetical protein